MVDIVSRRCQDPSCLRRPLYNNIGMRAVFCSKHKLPGMIDVVSTRCEQPVRTTNSGNLDAYRCLPSQKAGAERHDRPFTRAVLARTRKTSCT